MNQFTDADRGRGIEFCLAKAEYALQLKGHDHNGEEMSLIDRAQQILRAASENRAIEPHLFKLAWFIVRNWRDENSEQVLA